MSWSDTVNFQGEPVRGLGINFLPRGLYKVVTNNPENTTTPKSNKPCYMLHHVVQEAWLADAAGNLPSAPGNENINATLDNMLLKPEVGGDPDQNSWRESDIKTCLVAHGNGTREQLSQAAGPAQVTHGHFHGKTAYLIYDPPPEGEKYPKLKYVLPEDVNDLKTGKRRVPWPYDGKATRGNTVSATVGGGAAASFAQGAPVQGSTQAPPGFQSRPTGPQSAPAPTNPTNGVAQDVAALAGAAPQQQPAGQPGAAPQSW